MANVPDSTGLFVHQDSVFVGQLPDSLNVANTAVQWAGKRWTMIMWPLPDLKPDRLNLMMHELFHRIQPQLDFTNGKEINPHLDERMGRVLLRLELRALQHAVSGTGKVRVHHIRNALLFRHYRRLLFAGADSTEDNLERNEGLAEWTGLLLSGQTPAQMQNHLTHLLAQSQQTKNFARSFAYLTGPAYGFTLTEIQPDWNRKLRKTGFITERLVSAYSWRMPNDLVLAYRKAKKEYDGITIDKQEAQFEETRQVELRHLKGKFLSNNRLLIALHKMNISFNPGTLKSLPNQGTIYPTMRLVDEWGVLDVTNEALISTDWSQVTVSFPKGVNSSTQLIKTPEWTLTLEKSWSVQYQQEGIWTLKKGNE